MDVSEGRVKAIMANHFYNIPFNCVVSHRDREMKKKNLIKDFERGELYRFCRVCNKRVEPWKVKAHFETYVKK
jgi:ribosomal protein L33